MLPVNLRLVPLSLQDQPRLYALMARIYPPVYAGLWHDGGAAYLERNYGPEGFRSDFQTAGNAYYFAEYAGARVGLLLLNHGKANPDAPNIAATYVQKLYLSRRRSGAGLGPGHFGLGDGCRQGEG